MKNNTSIIYASPSDILTIEDSPWPVITTYGFDENINYCLSGKSIWSYGLYVKDLHDCKNFLNAATDQSLKQLISIVTNLTNLKVLVPDELHSASSNILNEVSVIPSYRQYSFMIMGSSWVIVVFIKQQKIYINLTSNILEDNYTTNTLDIKFKSVTPTSVVDDIINLVNTWIDELIHVRNHLDDIYHATVRHFEDNKNGI